MQRRVLTLAGALLVILLLGVPAAIAADHSPAHHGRVLLAVNGDVTLPAGESAETVIAIDGRATIHGTADTVVVIDGSAHLEGALVRSVVAIHSPVDLGAGTVVSGDVLTIASSVDRADGVQVAGAVRDVSGDLAGFGLALAAMLVLFYIGLGLATIAAGLLLAALAARQVRAAETLISREPWTVLAAGVAGILLAIVVVLATVATIVGAPIGLGILFVLLPAAAFIGYLVAAVWLGDLILHLASPGVTRDRPYLATVVGLVALLVLGLVPFVSLIASLFGFGAIVLLAWRTFRGTPALPSAGAIVPAPRPLG
jgi:hypothetical protein